MRLSDHVKQTIDALQDLLDHIDPGGLASCGKATPLVSAITNRTARLVSLLIPLEISQDDIPPQPPTTHHENTP